ncbi:hypothetical protein P152DRAFT_445050 [Eremomyces bilateralis CBS 781.70]|uniref:Uncharacterized protein n=1 Tax=Eremomyces bilateralis CBS 781.70 TaxID=1392243 RepID=A0A6G1GG26_9PEZI|nr:uncharacterized protein P152DRAFT_445050 [Eremomyces bilateralis CBS 781.70]KAF1816876.1 hypothetical protein P152DRAFT_445050 [Eremomyces bilateralis CBS 781.70]
MWDTLVLTPTRKPRLDALSNASIGILQLKQCANGGTTLAWHDGDTALFSVRRAQIFSFTVHLVWALEEEIISGKFELRHEITNIDGSTGPFLCPTTTCGHSFTSTKLSTAPITLSGTGMSTIYLSPINGWFSNGTASSGRLSRVIFGETQCFLWDFERYVDTAFRLNTDQSLNEMLVISSPTIDPIERSPTPLTVTSPRSLPITSPVPPSITPPRTITPSIIDPAEHMPERRDRKHPSLRKSIKKLFSFRRKDRRLSNPFF